MLGKRISIVIFMALLFVIVATLKAGATGTWTNCSGTTLTDPNINSTVVKCWEFDAQDDSNAVYVKTASALVCFDSNIDAEANGTARVMLRRCHMGTKPSANPEYTCGAILDTALDGTGGASGTQNACERVGPGVYYGEVTVSAGGQTASISFQGE